MSVQFVSHLGEVLSATQAKMERAAEVIGGMAESKAKEYVTEAVYSSPAGWYVRTGDLRNSIGHQTEGSGEGTTVVVGCGVKYAPYVELGTGGGGRKWTYKGSDGKFHTTSGMPARPFIRPAIENHISEYKSVLEQILKE